MYIRMYNWLPDISDVISLPLTSTCRKSNLYTKCNPRYVDSAVKRLNLMSNYKLCLRQERLCHLCRVAGDTVIPHGTWVPVAVWRRSWAEGSVLLWYAADRCAGWVGGLAGASAGRRAAGVDGEGGVAAVRGRSTPCGRALRRHGRVERRAERAWRAGVGRQAAPAETQDDFRSCFQRAGQQRQPFQPPAADRRRPRSVWPIRYEMLF